MKLLRAVVAAVIFAAIVPAMAAPECGEASWYDESAGAGSGMSAAHPTLPFGTKVIVENLDNGRTATLEISDRGPSTVGRIIDVSRAAAEQLDFVNAGVAHVRITTPGGSVGPACR